MRVKERKKGKERERGQTSIKFIREGICLNMALQK